MRDAVTFSLYILMCLIGTSVYAKDDIEFKIEEKDNGLELSVESKSIYNSRISLPIVISPNESSPGVHFRIFDLKGHEYYFCAQINYSSMPRESTLFYSHRISVVEQYGNIKRLYCLPPGKYKVEAVYNWLYQDGEMEGVTSNVLDITFQ
ncbi:MAG TPA: hypothetical protein VMR06_00820 [Dokdonella sp.]|uniref:hypothetical protein n=1 Tax=Dokdonella sp. TaxID=2291710 RepID=UPI002CDA955A|nr:hypothetical protein [Dokdonella sp.]HUD40520.1 hypothetical protein [Dokdonella sp.]